MRDPVGRVPHLASDPVAPGCRDLRQARNRSRCSFGAVRSPARCGPSAASATGRPCPRSIATPPVSRPCSYRRPRLRPLGSETLGSGYSATISAGVARRRVPSCKTMSVSPSGPTGPVACTGLPASAWTCLGRVAAGRKIQVSSAARRWSATATSMRSRRHDFGRRAARPGLARRSAAGRRSALVSAGHLDLATVAAR